MTTRRMTAQQRRAIKMRQRLEDSAAAAPVRSDRDPTQRGRHAPWLWEVGSK